MSARQPRILVAPDSFKGTLSATEVTAALARGIAEGGGEPDLCPLADGGEGTMAAFLAARGGTTHQVQVHDPLGRPIGARFGLLDGGTEAILDTAAASGFALLAADERDPLRADTSGTGELIAAAIEAGATRVLVAAGGSATVDGGRGAIEALRSSNVTTVELVVLCDVQSPYEDAAPVYSPQKGADAAAVRELTERLDAFADSLPRDPRGVPMSGCAGGLSGGLWAAFGAELVPGATRVLELVGFERRLREADLVVTGEGRLDGQSLRGKVVGEVLARCTRQQRELAIVVGQNALGPEHLPSPPLRSVEQAGSIDALVAAGRRLAEQPRAQEERPRAG